jgi:hypothetical protein
MRQLGAAPSALTLFALCACAGNPQQLPVAVSACNTVAGARGLGIVANVENKSYRPISRLTLTTAFYQDFRYQRLTASATLQNELDPGQKRYVTFIVGESTATLSRGQAIRCLVTHIGYLDGTSQDAPPNQ